MHVFSVNNSDFLTIEKIEADPQGVGIRLAIEVHQGDFSGAARVWVLVDAWKAFVESLTALEQRREGSATVEGMSPQQLRLTFGITDRLGHLAVDGSFSHDSAHRTTLTFAQISLDPTALPELLRSAREIAG